MDQNAKSLNERRDDLEREKWVKNVMRIQGYSREEAEEFYNRINDWATGYLMDDKKQPKSND